jgi:hypothetical protein
VANERAGPDVARADGRESAIHQHDLAVNVDARPRACLPGPSEARHREVWMPAQLFETPEEAAKGRALPLKLMFNQQLDIDYSQNEMPRAYREIFKARKPIKGEKEAVLNFINDRKMSISFHFLPLTDNADGKLCTDISIMQDFRVLEPIKENMPHLYSELNKRAAISDAGKFYLLDTIRGYKDV